MRITVDAAELRSAVSRALPAVADNPGVASLGCILFNPGDGVLSLTGTDLVFRIDIDLEADCESDTAFPVPAAKLAGVTRACSGTVVFERGDRQLVIGNERTRWRLPLPTISGFPVDSPLVECSVAAVSVQSLINALKFVQPAMSKLPLQPSLRFARIKDGFVTVSDGFRLHRAELPGFSGTVLLPDTRIEYILKLLATVKMDEVSLGGSDGCCVIEAPAMTCTVQHPVTDYPDVEQLILNPAEANKATMSIPRESLLHAARRIKIAIDPKEVGVCLEADADSTVALACRDSVGAVAWDVLEGTDWDGGARQVFVNPAHLFDVLRVHESDVLDFRFGVDTKTRKTPVLITSDNGRLVSVIPQLTGAIG